jgi:uncharacterized protein YjbI with pentapeptide repeats
LRAHSTTTSGHSVWNTDLHAIVKVITRRNTKYDATTAFDLSHIKLSSADFRKAVLDGSDFQHAELHNAHFKGAKLRGATFFNAKLEHAHFEGADLRDADFLGARLQGVDFSGANCDGARFCSADLMDAGFDGTRIAGAIFQKPAPTDIDDLPIDDAQGLTIDQLSRARDMQKALLPGYLTSAEPPKS